MLTVQDGLPGAAVNRQGTHRAVGPKDNGFVIEWFAIKLTAAPFKGSHFDWTGHFVVCADILEVTEAAFTWCEDFVFRNDSVGFAAAIRFCVEGLLPLSNSGLEELAEASVGRGTGDFRLLVALLTR